MGHDDDVRILKRELRGLFDHIQRIRQEIAAIRKPGSAEDRFATMSDELDAIVDNTESATNTIMENAESIDDIIQSVRPAVQDEAATSRLDNVPDLIGGIFEACSFQDITGQRITKVVKTLQYIERRVNSLISIWGEEALTTVDPPEDPMSQSKDESHLLHGPQLAGHGVSQTEVDAILRAGNGVPAEPNNTSQAKTAPTSKPESKAAPQKAASTPPSDTAGGAAKQPSKVAPKKNSENGSGMGQDDIDKLFG